MLSERCITYGSPQLIAGYQSYYQIFQTADAVVLMTEMIHDVRIIPLDGRPHVASNIHNWFGDSRGHWEGDTLVIDTTNYKAESFMPESSDKLHVIERLTRTGPEILKYEITIDDPATWTKPWSLMIPLRHSPDPIFEYACHEGNIGMQGILAGARAEEKAAAEVCGESKVRSRGKHEEISAVCCGSVFRRRSRFRPGARTLDTDLGSGPAARPAGAGSSSAGGNGGGSASGRVEERRAAASRTDRQLQQPDRAHDRSYQHRREPRAH